MGVGDKLVVTWTHDVSSLATPNNPSARTTPGGADLNVGRDIEDHGVVRGVIPGRPVGLPRRPVSVGVHKLPPTVEDCCDLLVF